MIEAILKILEAVAAIATILGFILDAKRVYKHREMERTVSKKRLGQ